MFVTTSRWWSCGRADMRVQEHGRTRPYVKLYVRILQAFQHSRACADTSADAFRVETRPIERHTPRHAGPACPIRGRAHEFELNATCSQANESGHARKHSQSMHERFPSDLHAIGYTRSLRTHKHALALAAAGLSMRTAAQSRHPVRPRRAESGLCGELAAGVAAAAGRARGRRALSLRRRRRDAPWWPRAAPRARMRSALDCAHSQTRSPEDARTRPKGVVTIAASVRGVMRVPHATLGSLGQLFDHHCGLKVAPGR
eukprot:376577-Pleurochrysis_carterae.AAC.1